MALGYEAGHHSAEAPPDQADGASGLLVHGLHPLNQPLALQPDGPGPEVAAKILGPRAVS